MEYDEYNNILVDYSGLICFIYDVKTTEIVYMTKACMELLKITKAEEYVGHADKRAYYQTDHRDRRNRFYTGQLDKKIRDIKNN